MERTVPNILMRAYLIDIGRVRVHYAFLRRSCSPSFEVVDIAMEDVILETSMGTIVCEMYYDHAPRTCKNFVELVCFDGTKYG
jgi:hypothetical protein